MANIYKLRNQFKHYNWGSPELIPRLMGITPNTPSLDGAQATMPTGIPVAELWMGNHSTTTDAQNKPGGEIAEQFGALPFLFKLLAAEKPLSVQVHPNLEQARRGFERENNKGLALDAPNRNYRDPNHKPEILCALSPFTGMCGFRSPDEIRQLFDVFTAAPPMVRRKFIPFLHALEITYADLALRNFIRLLFSLDPVVRMSLTEFILWYKNESSEWKLVQKFAQAYPLDPAILAPLYLNIFRLEPGEAIFLQAGVPHAYISGMGVELMANSDNVLRGGLTTKYIDVRELIKVLDYNPLEPRIMKPEQPQGDFSFTYPAPCEEFSLTVMHGTGGKEQTFTHNTPAICIVTEGEVSVSSGVADSGIILKQGESAFIPPVGSPLVLQGRYTLYAASVPS